MFVSNSILCHIFGFKTLDINDTHLLPVHTHIFIEAIAFKSDPLYHFATTKYVHFLFNIFLNFCHANFHISFPSQKLRLILSIFHTFLELNNISIFSLFHHILSVCICIQY